MGAPDSDSVTRDPISALTSLRASYPYQLCLYVHNSDMTSQRPWNRDAKEHVLHDPRNFIVGLSDEGGAGANVGFASKQHYAPVQAEVAALDMYINSTLWGAHCPAAPIEYQANCSLQVQTSELRCLFFL